MMFSYVRLQSFKSFPGPARALYYPVQLLMIQPEGYSDAVHQFPRHSGILYFRISIS